MKITVESTVVEINNGLENKAKLPHTSGKVIGASLSEPHIDEFAVYIYTQVIKKHLKCNKM